MASSHNFKKTYQNFYERQRLRNPYIFSALLLSEIIFVYLSLTEILNHEPFIFSTFSEWPVVIFTLLGPTLLLILYYVVYLETVINEEGIFYRWRPMKKSYHMVDYSAVREISLVDLKKENASPYLSKKYKSVSYMGGGVGFRITMKSGRTKLIGTHKAEELNRILTRVAGKQYKPSTIGQNLDFSD